MSHERLKHLKESLMTCIEGQMCNVYEADTEELGEAIDMLKDLEEALYYCTITEAMEGGDKKRHREGKGDYEWSAQGMGDYGKGHNMAYDERGRSYMMYNDGRSSGSNGGNSNGGNYGGGRSYIDGGRGYMDPGMNRDYREGRSPEVRRMYMEARDMGKDKTMQIKELEHYMQELSSDVVEMIQEAGTEEKQYLEKKLLALASKIGQMK